MTIVETVLVLCVFLLLLFGLFEYCRFLMVLHVSNNAARDGARYAVVNVGKPSNFDTTNYTDSGGNTFQSIQSYTTARMGGINQQIVGYQVAVYAVDNAGLALSPPVIRPKSSNPPTYPNPFNPSDPNKVAWNAATFTERIAVQIQGTYRPVTPLSVTNGLSSFGIVPDNIPINVTAMMGSEG
jgi:Flp pilus assembly protein TadG